MAAMRCSSARVPGKRSTHNGCSLPRSGSAIEVLAGHPIVAPLAGEFHHNVYVILLDPKAARHPSILRANPKRNPRKPCVYVGMSGLPPEHRFENHKHGYKAAWVVEKYGVRLVPELYEHLNPMPYEAALQMEADLAEDLRAEGYTVTGGH